MYGCLTNNEYFAFGTRGVADPASLPRGRWSSAAVIDSRDDSIFVVGGASFTAPASGDCASCAALFVCLSAPGRAFIWGCAAVMGNDVWRLHQRCLPGTTGGYPSCANCAGTASSLFVRGDSSLFVLFSAANTWKDAIGSESCNACPVSTAAPQGATSIFGCTCVRVHAPP